MEHPRWKEFLKGFFWPAVFGAIGMCTWPLFVWYDQAHQLHNPGGETAPFAALLAVVATAVLAVRWWKRARWRAYGAIAGLVGAPALVTLLLAGLMLLLNLSPAPH